MKKVKLMLLSLSILAVVGGTLAFKARGSFDYCTAPTVENQSCSTQACPTRGDLKDGGSIFVCTTTTSLNADFPCKKANHVTDLDCTQTSAQIITE
jgi:hypothetical protein